MKLFVIGGTWGKGVSKAGAPYSIPNILCIQSAKTFTHASGTRTATGNEQVEWNCTEECFYQVQSLNIPANQVMPLEFEVTTERRGKNNITVLLAVKGKAAA